MPDIDTNCRGGGIATNQSSRLQLLLGALAIVLIGSLAIVAVANPLAVPQPSRGAATPVPAPTGPPAPPPPIGTTYRDFAFDPAAISAPTESRTQSRLWFAEGHWWAAMFQPTSNHLAIFRLDPARQVWADTGVLVDERPIADVDLAWNGTHLYAISGGTRATPTHALRIVRFSYETATERFMLDPNFPVPLTDSGANAANIAIDGAGVVWATYVLDGRVWLAHTLADDALWSRPAPLAAAGTVGAEDIASVVAFGPGRIGVMWSDQDRRSVALSVHEDGDPDDAWSAPETVLDAIADATPHLSVKTYPLGSGTGILVALKTSLAEGVNVNSLDPLIMLAVRAADGTWANHLVSQVRDRQTRPVVMVDAGARLIYVAASAPNRNGAIFYKRASLDRIGFDTGDGVPLVASATDLRINDATTSKDPLTTGSGLLVLASDRDTDRYLHAVVDLGSGLPTADPADPARPTVPDAADPKRQIAVLRNDFEPWPVGRAGGTMWAGRPEDPTRAISIVDDGSGGRALRVKASVAAGVRACREFPAIAGAKLSIKARVRVSGIGVGDTPMVSIRGTGGEAASIRATDRSVFAWFNGRTKIRSNIGFRPKAWYRITLTIHQAKRTYDMTIATDTGRTLVKRAGLRWRTAAVRSVRDICVGSAGSRPAQTIDLAEVHVLREPGS